MTPRTTFSSIPAQRTFSKADPSAFTALQATDNSPSPHPSTNEDEVSASAQTLTIFQEQGSVTKFDL